MHPKNESKCNKASPVDAPLMSMYGMVIAHPSPINFDLPHLKHIASICGPQNDPGDVVEIVHQSVSAIALLAGKPKSVMSYGSAPNGSEKRIEMLRNYTAPLGIRYEASPSMPNGSGIPVCDLLFLDVDPHTSDHYLKLLRQYSPYVRRFIAIHDSVIYGQKYNEAPGLMFGVSQFLTESNQQWFVAGHHKEQNGLLVLSRRSNDRIEMITGVPEEVVLAKNPPQIAAQTPEGKTIQIPTEGPGTELKAILASLGIQPSSNCDCNGKAAQMNLWGVAGCKANRETIIGWMKDGAPNWGWLDQMKAAARAVTTGLAFQVSWTDPFPGIVDLSIQRAEEKEKASGNDVR